LRHFRLSDRDLAALAAGRPSPGTLTELRKAQLSRHLLLLSEILKAETPMWYASSQPRHILADPVTGLYAATAVSMMRSGGRPPDRPTLIGTAPVVTVTCEGLTLRVRLEDTDQLRDRLGLSPTDRLSPSEVAHWERLLSESWQLLVRHHRPPAEILADVLRVIVPVEPDPAADGVSATSAHAYGAVAMSAPTDPVSLAAGLIHETAHSLLNATTLLFGLVQPSRTLGYSPWRDDPRPASGVLHGAYAYLAVTRFWRTEAARSGSRLAQFEFARWRAAVAAATDSLLNDRWTDRSGTELSPSADDVLTAVGRRFVGVLRAEVGQWLDEPVDGEVARLAAGANVDHRVRWRLRNLRVADETTRALVDAWKQGRPAPELPEPEVVAGTRRLEVSGRLDLVHRWLREADRERARALGTRQDDRSERAGAQGEARGVGRERGGALGDRPGMAGGGVRPGDVAWLGGEGGTSRDAYVLALESGSETDAALAGLALVAPERVFTERPEVVRALWLALEGRPPLGALVAWLSRT
jgi:hypothetical protein